MSHAIRFTDANFEEEVLGSDIPVLVDFWASWCLPSQESKPIMEQLAAEYKGQVKVGMLHTDQNPRMRESYQIEGCPTFILFIDGKEVQRRKGSQSKEQLAQMLKEAVERRGGGARERGCGGEEERR